MTEFFSFTADFPEPARRAAPLPPPASLIGTAPTDCVLDPGLAIDLADARRALSAHPPPAMHFDPLPRLETLALRYGRFDCPPVRCNPDAPVIVAPPLAFEWAVVGALAGRAARHGPLDLRLVTRDGLAVLVLPRVLCGRPAAAHLAPVFDAALAALGARLWPGPGDGECRLTWPGAAILENRAIDAQVAESI